MKTQFDTYKHELSKSKYDIITDRLKEKELILRLGTSPPHDFVPKDIDAFHQLINSNLRFVVYILKEFSIPSTVSIMDIIQEGNLGLMIGICRFDAVKYPDIKLFSFVVHWIRLFIRVALAKNKVYENRRAYLGEDESLETTSRLDKNSEGIFTTTHITSDHIAEQIALEDIDSFLLSYLTKREAAVIRLYFGLGNSGDEKTLEVIGQQLHIKFVRVRQIRDRALSKLQKVVYSGELAQYL